MTDPSISHAPVLTPDVFLFPASLGQRRLWFSDKKNPGRATQNIIDAAKVIGPLDLEVFRRSVCEVVRRHESLRTHFTFVDGEPQQVIEPNVTLDVPVIDLSSLPQQERENEARRLAQTEIDTSFDLESFPLCRIKLLRLSQQEHVMVLVMHHIISDGWSLGVMLGEFSTLYTAFIAGKPSPLPELSIQFVDFSEWQREMLQEPAWQEQIAYWKNRLTGAPALVLPYDRPKTMPPPGKGGSYTLFVEDELAKKLRDLSYEQNVTLFMTLLAAHETLFFRYSGQTDIVLGSGIANRQRPELEGVIGYFTNLLVMRMKLSGEWTFEELLTHVKEMTLGAYANQDIPLERLIDELVEEQDSNRPLIFHATFNVQNLPRVQFQLGKAVLRPYELEAAFAKTDLSTFVSDTGGPILYGILYNMDIFDEETIDKLFQDLAALLRSIVQNPRQRLTELALLHR